MCGSVFRTWGFHLGRPFRTHSENITVARPQAKQSSSRSTVPWVPYVSAEQPVEWPLETLDVSEIHQQRLKLVEVMAPVANAVYESHNPGVQKPTTSLLTSSPDTATSASPVKHYRR